MQLFENFRRNQFRKALIRQLAQQKRHRKITNILRARSIGILFDGSNGNDARYLVDFSKALAKEGRKVKLLGFVAEKKETTPHAFDAVNLKAMTWTGAVKPTPQTEVFLKEKFELLLCVNPVRRRPLEYLAVMANAGMKIGSATDLPNDFDIILETPAGKSAQYFMEQLDVYLEKIVQSNESTVK